MGKAWKSMLTPLNLVWLVCCKLLTSDFELCCTASWWVSAFVGSVAQRQEWIHKRAARPHPWYHSSGDVHLYSKSHIKRFIFSMVTLHPSCRNHSSSNNSTISCFMSYGVSRSFYRGRHCRNCLKSWNCKAHGVHLSASTPVFAICHYLHGICHVIQRWHTRCLPAKHNYEAPTWNRVLNLPPNFLDSAKDQSYRIEHQFLLKKEIAKKLMTMKDHWNGTECAEKLRIDFTKVCVSMFFLVILDAIRDLHIIKRAVCKLAIWIDYPLVMNRDRIRSYLVLFYQEHPSFESIK